MDIKDMDLKDLKALAYDTLGQIEKLQRDLRIINQLIAQKSANSGPKPPQNPENPEEDASKIEESTQ